MSPDHRELRPLPMLLLLLSFGSMPQGLCLSDCGIDAGSTGAASAAGIDGSGSCSGGSEMPRAGIAVGSSCW